MSNNTDILQRGDKIGCYRIEEVLGRGGFAVTYLATDENLDVEVAIKEYLPREITQRDANLNVSARKPEFAEDYDVGLENFAREAKTLARFKHPNIVRVHQVLHANNTAYMVMEFEHGQELGEILERNKTFTENELRNILFPILDGVEEIHRHGFVHRDIKPSNIYVRHNGSPVLIDFGAARYTMSETTQQLTAVVTVGYTPIEQYNVSEDAQGPWSDIYALAAVCYEAVTGAVPTDSVTRASASVTQGDDPLPSVRSQTNDDYSDDCLDAIDWGLRMEAEDRPQVIAQWRDSFDGIFNPASAYKAQTDVSIYSPHRVDSPRQPETASISRTASNTSREPVSAQMSSSAQAGTDDVLSIPLRTTETPLDSGVVSLDKDSVVTTMPPPIPRSTSAEQSQDTSIAVNDHTSARHSANDPTSRNVLRRDSETDTSPTEQPPKEAPKRSKFERPEHLGEAAPKKKMIRDEIQFNDSDWDYDPPKKRSPLKLLLPVLGLAAVVGGSVTLVNFPELVTNLVSSKPDLNADQALKFAEIKIETENYIFPAGDSALDYYKLVLKQDPDNLEALAGIRAIESEVREQISDNMKKNNLSEANRILARSDDAGLSGVYNASDLTQTTETEVTTQTTIAETSPVVISDGITTDGVTTGNNTVVTPVNTTSLEPTSTSSETRQQQLQQNPTPEQSIRTTISTRVPSTGIDNNVSPFIEEKITELNSLIEQKRFAEARTLYSEVDKFIPVQSSSNRILRAIEAGEATAATARAAASNSTSVVAAPQTDTSNTNTTLSVAASITASSEPTSTSNGITPDAQAPITPTEPPRNSYIDASGPAADHLNRLRLAIEAKDIEAVQAVSQTLPEGRIRFLNSTFARHHRLDVTIEEVTTSGNTITGKLNLAMFGRSEDGSVYGAGKWNGVTIQATRSNGEWQNIRW